MFRFPLFPLIVLLTTARAVAAEPEAWPALTFHAAPKAPGEGAKTEEWPGFLGPKHRPESGETGLLKEFPETGPKVVWECRRGAGYAAPVIAEGKLLLFHRLDGKERLECLEPETGKRFWSEACDAEYTDDFGYSDGPRAAPAVAAGKVVTFGVTSRLTCRDLATGAVVWEKDCAKAYQVPKYFFGSGAGPLIQGDRVILNLGGGGGECVAAFDLKTGEERWVTKHEWGQSYATAVPVTWRGKDRVLVFAGGKSEPAIGGLLSVDPATGAADDTFFWRAKRFPSVNASSPVLCGENRVFVSQAYVDRNSPCNGGVMLEAGEDGKFREVWKQPALGCHWMTPVWADGCLFAFSGEKDRQCELACFDGATGQRLWGDRTQWEHTDPSSPGRTIPMGFFRASLLRAEGRYLCLGEWGTLAWLELSREGMKRGSRAQLFVAQQAWTPPVISRGLLYICQNEEDRLNGAPARLLCYDFRAEK